ncbi:MAG: IucA/IucC family protein [Tumebacillaceae bacterium]
MKQNELQELAENAVLLDLVNALLQENWMGLTEQGRVTANLDVLHWEEGFELEEEERYFQYEVASGSTILFRVRTEQFLQPYKISRLPVLLAPLLQPLGAVELMRLLGGSAPNLEGFIEDLQTAVEQSALSLAASLDWKDGDHSDMLRWERFSALRDRPFHPTSRAKQGWNREQYQRYSPEFGEEIALDWVAVRRTHIRHGEQAGEIAPSVLSVQDQLRLEVAMAKAGASARTHMAMPVHPWQMEYALPGVYAKEIEQGIVVPLGLSAGRFAATSSLRALAPLPEGKFHVKVPIGIFSLAALRILPLRYLQNAERAQAVLQQVIQADPHLCGMLRLCGEERWWGFDDPEGDFFGDKPGHLACLIREYPREWLSDKSLQLIAMSTLAVVDWQGEVPAFEAVRLQRGGTPVELFEDIARSFAEMGLSCFRYGLMPEVHGQNVMLAFREGRVAGVLLRDHDTIRLHLPWLEREGFADPGYVVKPGTPNSLINPTPEKLLSYFQTLGLQVNLYAIADAISRAYGIEESVLWGVIREVVEHCLSVIEFPADVRDVIARQLLESPTWPTRTLIGPLLKREGSGGGSMPADTGETENPLLRLT